jgi:1-deoxy-D-xylulose 5-phosphate reductoisomerase
MRNTFKNLINESGMNVKKVEYRENGSISSTVEEYSHSMADKSSVAGFIATKANIAEGYVIYLPTKEELSEFGKDALRVVWSKGTTIVKVDAKKGKIYFLDNSAYEDGKVKYQSAMAYDRLVIDDSSNGNKLQEITKIV